VREVRTGSGDVPRVAYAIGRRAGSAVVRNRIRRRLREAIRAEAAGLEPGSALLFGAGPDVVNIPFEVLRADVRTLLRSGA
jgi:ribonuclease P protein component